jgi:hypothetical protein
MIDYILRQNTLAASGGEPAGYHAQTVQTNFRTRGDFLNTMMTLRGGITRGEAEAALELVSRAFIAELSDGGNVSLPELFSAKIDIQGVFPEADSAFDPAANSLHVGIRAAVRRAIAGTSTHRVSDSASGLYIGHARDTGSGTTDDLLTPGMVLQILGTKLKIVGERDAVGVFFVGEDGAETPAAEHALSRNGEKQLDVVVPALAPGLWRVKVVTQYSSGATLLKIPRSYTFALPLAVHGA